MHCIWEVYILICVGYSQEIESHFKKCIPYIVIWKENKGKGN